MKTLIGSIRLLLRSIKSLYCLPGELNEVHMFAFLVQSRRSIQRRKSYPRRKMSIGWPKRYHKERTKRRRYWARHLVDYRIGKWFVVIKSYLFCFYSRMISWTEIPPKYHSLKKNPSSGKFAFF